MKKYKGSNIFYKELEPFFTLNLFTNHFEEIFEKYLPA